MAGAKFAPEPRREDDGIMAMSKPLGGLTVEFQPMSFEEMQRTMQFLLDSGARVDARLHVLTEKTDRIADGLIGLTAIVGRVVQQQEELTRRQEELTQQQKETDRKLADVGEHLKATDARLNIVIDMFERHLREDHGHRPS